MSTPIKYFGLADSMGDCSADSYRIKSYSSVSYQQATNPKYDRRRHESPSGYDPLQAYTHDNVS